MKNNTCFFCDIWKNKKEKPLLETKDFYVRFDEFPVSSGHVEIITKKHIVSFFELTAKESVELFFATKKAKKIIDKKFHPDGYTIGINEGESSGRTIPHFHLHLIPRFWGDVKNPHGGVRKVIPKKSNYISKA